MPWSYANIDWNGTGAMVQAVGSVAAILAAVWIDQGTTRRAAAERRATDRRAIGLRMEAINRAEWACGNASYRMKEIAYGRAEPGHPGPDEVVKRAHALVRFYLDLSADLHPEVASALLSAAEAMGQLEEHFDSMSFRAPENWPSVEAALQATARELRDTIDRCEGLVGDAARIR